MWADGRQALPGAWGQSNPGGLRHVLSRLREKGDVRRCFFHGQLPLPARPAPCICRRVRGRVPYGLTAWYPAPPRAGSPCSWRLLAVAPQQPAPADDDGFSHVYCPALFPSPFRGRSLRTVCNPGFFARFGLGASRIGHTRRFCRCTAKRAGRRGGAGGIHSGIGPCGSACNSRCANGLSDTACHCRAQLFAHRHECQQPDSGGQGY